MAINNLYPDPFVKRPRIYIKLPNDKIELVDQRKNNAFKRRPALLTIGLPILTIASYLMMFIFTKRQPIYMLPMLITMLGSISFSVWSFITDRKKLKESNPEEDYQDYLDSTTSNLSELRGKTIEVLNKRFLETQQLVDKIDQNDLSLFSVNYDDFDFLDYSVGLGEIKPNYQLNLQNTRPENKNILSIYNHFSKISNAPVSINAKDNLGVVGDSKLTTRYVQNRLIQLMFNHSYHDLRIAVLTDSTEWKNFGNQKHLNILRNKIEVKKYFDELSIVFNERKSKQSDNKAQTFIPHFLVIVENPKLFENTAITQYIDKNSYKLNLSVIYIDESKNSLPSYISNIVEIKNQHSGLLSLLKNEKENIPFSFNLIADKDLKTTLDILGKVNHISENQSALPEKLTFFDLFDAQKVADLNISKNWTEYESVGSLSVPIGKTSAEDLMFLDIHEKGDGPHGLVAGTTGSGKSELISTFLLSLATLYRPEYISFLIIDFKGGGLANLFEKVPHLLGSITNLNKRTINRSLDSIKAELEHRERLFQEYKINNINDYISLYLKDKTMEPLPHLLMVVDEFAEVKQDQPNFFKQLTSVARVGRSLGVHLLLATQKPRGVVDDQVWSNSKYKIALKMQDTSDSKEVLKTEDAAGIKEVGRAYLQVGNNEKYQLFQSAYSAAKYEKSTQFNAIADEMVKVSKQLKVERLQAPWLDELPTTIISPIADKAIDLSQTTFNPIVPLGMLDLPKVQRQENIDFNLLELKNTIIVGNSQMGKSSALINIIVNLSKNNNPELINFNLFDFSNNDLLSISDLPQVANYVTLESELELSSLIKQVNQQIEERKKLLKQLKAKNIDEYNEIAENKLPIQVNVLDNFDAIKNHKFEEAIYNLFSKIVRDGQSLGFYLIITSHLFSNINQNFSNLINTRIALFIESHDQLTQVLTTKIDDVEEEPGRFGIVIGKDVTFGQLYQPTKDHKDIFNQVKKIKASWKGPLPESIPKVPDDLSLQYLQEHSKHKISVGFDVKTAEPIALDSGTIIISENSGEIHSQFIEIIKVQLDKFTGQVFYLDNQDDINQFDLENIQADSIYYIENFEKFMENKPIDEVAFRKLISEIDKINSVLVIQSDDFFLEDASYKMKELLSKKAEFSLTFSRISEQNYLPIHNQTATGEPFLNKNEANYFDGRSYGVLKFPEI